jgi:hypothetical protein
VRASVRIVNAFPVMYTYVAAVRTMPRLRCCGSVSSGMLTLICLASQEPVARPWSLDCGLPGSTALILPNSEERAHRQLSPIGDEVFDPTGLRGG